MNDLVLPYRGKFWLGPTVTLFFGTAAYFVSPMGGEPPRIGRAAFLMRLFPEYVTQIEWALAAVSVLFALAGLYLTAVWLRGARVVRLGADRVSLPRRGLGKREMVIAFDEIHALRQTSQQGQDFLVIEHAGGNTALAEVNFASRAAFNDFRNQLQARVFAGAAISSS